ncbi:MAG: T9SS type A sorting domain-containing protein [Saprospiraceae bacterium]
MKNLLITLLIAFNCVVCFGQFNKNYSFSLNSYTDATTVKATELVNDREIMTIGYAREEGAEEDVNDIVIVKARKKDGKVLWARTYGLNGLDEKGFGLTVTYDKRHVIVCGSAENSSSENDWNALAMKINIETGDVVWSSQVGEIDENEEFRMIERVYSNEDAAGITSPTYMLAGSTSLNRFQLPSVLYAASINDSNGDVQWANYYTNPNTEGQINDFAFSMVRSDFTDEFVIAGTRKTEGTSRVFTFRVNPYNGNPGYWYTVMQVSDLNQYGGAICNVSWDDNTTVGFALACTSKDPEVEGDVSEAITVLILDGKGKSMYGGLYWEQGYTGNRGLSIYQNAKDDRQSTLDVYTNTFNEAYEPGFMSVDISGPVNYFQKYEDSEQFDDKLPTSMVQNQYGYTAKVLNTNQEGSRFQLIQLDQNGKTDCTKEANMFYQHIESHEELIRYEKTESGRSSERNIEAKYFNTGARGCESEESAHSKIAKEFSESNSKSNIRVYPNPASDVVKVSFEEENIENGSVVLMSAIGKVLYERHLVLDNRTVEFDMVDLPSGMYFIQFTNALGNTEIEKVIKQ